MMMMMMRNRLKSRPRSSSNYRATFVGLRLKRVELARQTAGRPACCERAVWARGQQGETEARSWREVARPSGQSGQRQWLSLGGERSCGRRAERQTHLDADESGTKSGGAFTLCFRLAGDLLPRTELDLSWTRAELPLGASWRAHRQRAAGLD